MKLPCVFFEVGIEVLNINRIYTSFMLQGFEGRHLSSAVGSLFISISVWVISIWMCLVTLRKSTAIKLRGSLFHSTLLSQVGTPPRPLVHLRLTEILKSEASSVSPFHRDQ